MLLGVKPGRIYGRNYWQRYVDLYYTKTHRDQTEKLKCVPAVYLKVSWRLFKSVKSAVVLGWAARPVITPAVHEREHAIMVIASKCYLGLTHTNTGGILWNMTSVVTLVVRLFLFYYGLPKKLTFLVFLHISVSVPRARCPQMEERQITRQSNFLLM